jgi:hypothetical protein
MSAWQYQVSVEHGPPHADEYLATCSKGLVCAAYAMGMHVGLMADAILGDSAVDGIRPLRALVALKDRFPVQDIDRVCERLIGFGLAGYTSVKNELTLERERAAGVRPHFRFARAAAYYQEVIHG